MSRGQGNKVARSRLPSKEGQWVEGGTSLPSPLSSAGPDPPRPGWETEGPGPGRALSWEPLPKEPASPQPDQPYGLGPSREL